MERVISLGVKLGYLKRPTKEQYIELTPKGILAKDKGGVIEFEKLEQAKEDKIIYKENLGLEIKELQKDALQYEETIRNLKEELMISNLLKNWWWLISAAIVVGIAIGKFLV